MLIIIASSIFNIANVDETRLFITTAVIFAYFLSKNLLKESSQRVSCINCLIFSSTMISIFGILERIFGSQLYEWTELKTLNYYVNHITSFFESSTTLSIYLVVMIPLIIGQLLNSKFGIKFVLLLFSLIVNITCLIFTKEIISGLVLLVIVLLMFALINKKFFILYLLSIPPIAVLIAFFKDPLSKLIEVERNAFIERFTINHSIVSFFQKYNVIGIGGGNAFSRVYPLFAENGNYAITSLCNTYFQVFLEYGIFGIILVVAILFIFAQMAMYCYVKSNTTKENKMFSLSIFIAMLGLVLLGFTSYIFIDIRVFLMFFLLLGLCTAHTNEVLSFERTNINNIYE